MVIKGKLYQTEVANSPLRKGSHTPNLQKIFAPIIFNLICTFAVIKNNDTSCLFSHIRNVHHH